MGKRFFPVLLGILILSLFTLQNSFADLEIGTNKSEYSVGEPILVWAEMINESTNTISFSLSDNTVIRYRLTKLSTISPSQTDSYCMKIMHPYDKNNDRMQNGGGELNVYVKPMASYLTHECLPFRPMDLTLPAENALDLLNPLFNVRFCNYLPSSPGEDTPLVTAETSYQLPLNIIDERVGESVRVLSPGKYQIQLFINDVSINGETYNLFAKKHIIIRNNLPTIETALSSSSNLRLYDKMIFSSSSLQGENITWLSSPGKSPIAKTLLQWSDDGGLNWYLKETELFNGNTGYMKNNKGQWSSWVNPREFFQPGTYNIRVLAQDESGNVKVFPDEDKFCNGYEITVE